MPAPHKRRRPNPKLIAAVVAMRLRNKSRGPYLERLEREMVVARAIHRSRV